MVMGRPTDYSEEIIETICTRLSEGESLKKICDSDGMPTRTTVFKWLQRYPDFADKYRQARLWQADTHADEIVDIADSARDRDDTPAKKLQVDARIWVASRMKPRSYGVKPDPDGETTSAKIEEGMTFRVVRADVKADD